MAEIYIRLNYDAYKALEKACRDCHETTHTSTAGFYHKSIRLPLGDGSWIEFHSPLVKAGEQA